MLQLCLTMLAMAYEIRSSKDGGIGDGYTFHTFP
jgi:hypothetical protein